MDTEPDPEVVVGPGSIAIEIPARSDFVSFVRVVVAAAAELRPDIAIERIEDLKLAVSEAVTNSINAQDRIGTIDRIRIECEVADDEITVFIPIDCCTSRGLASI